jgi:hypothetical protein
MVTALLPYRKLLMQGKTMESLHTHYLPKIPHYIYVGVPGLSWSFILHQDLCSHVSTMQRAPSVQFPIQCKKHHQFIHHLLSNPYH